MRSLFAMEYHPITNLLALVMEPVLLLIIVSVILVTQVLHVKFRFAMASWVLLLQFVPTVEVLVLLITTVLALQIIMVYNVNSLPVMEKTILIQRFVTEEKVLVVTTTIVAIVE